MKVVWKNRVNFRWLPAILVIGSCRTPAIHQNLVVSIVKCNLHMSRSRYKYNIIYNIYGNISFYNIYCIYYIHIFTEKNFFRVFLWGFWIFVDASTCAASTCPAAAATCLGAVEDDYYREIYLCNVGYIFTRHSTNKIIIYYIYNLLTPMIFIKYPDPIQRQIILGGVNSFIPIKN